MNFTALQPHTQNSSPTARKHTSKCLFIRAAASSLSSEDEQTYTRQERPAITRALGVDYGRRQVGLAVSTLGLAPRPLNYVNGARNVSEVVDVAKSVIEVATSEGCDAVIIGVPVTYEGALHRRSSDSQQGRRCRNFAEAVAALSVTTNLTVMIVDERGTTMKAERYLYDYGKKGSSKVKGMKDSVAATFILDAYFMAPEGAICVRPPKLGRKRTGTVE